MAAAHFFTEIWRLGINRGKRIDGAERRREPRQAAIIKTALKQLCRLLGADRAGPCAKYDCDQPAAVACR